MNSSDKTPHTDPSASIIARRAADFVSAQRSPRDWSDERQAELDAWLSQSLAHRVAFLRIDAAWQRAERISALRTPMRAAPPAARRPSGIWHRIAVAFGLATTVGFLASQHYPLSQPQLIETPKGGLEKVTLVDGSQIELNTDTAIKVDFRRKFRAVRLLRGEAYFEVKHDAARPFAVAVGDRRIVDLGTKFVVRVAPRELKVSLLEGEARLEEDKQSAHPLVLIPGDVVIAKADTTRLFRLSKPALADTLAWRRGSIVFHYERLSDAVAELNRYGGSRLVVADDYSAKLQISGTFLTNRPEEFAGVVHEIFGLRVEHLNGNLILSR